MTKFDDYGLLAEKYYVEEQLSVSEISEKLNISTKTLTEWKKGENWEEKRKTYLSSQYSCYSALQELLMYLSKDALMKIKSGEVPESASLNFIAKMAEKLPKLKAINEEKNKQQTNTDTQTQIAELIDKKLMHRD
ncbi:DUF1804 family protein [bacterium]|nr:DUF1804 family protein [bacterium]